MAAIKLVRKDCGKHWGRKPGPCQKCPYFAKQLAEEQRQGYLQHNGTPWIAVLGPVVARVDKNGCFPVPFD